jgi:hypothetical protein
MVPANKLVALDFALAEKSALVRTTAFKCAPSRLGSEEGNVDSTCG